MYYTKVGTGYKWW